MGKYEQTDIQIQEAFTELLREKKMLHNITVTELAKRANVTRATFYSHYNNVNEIVIALEHNLHAWLVKERCALLTREDLETQYRCIADFLLKHRDIYSNLFKADNASVFVRGLNNVAYDYLYSAFLANPNLKNKERLAMFLHFYIDGAFSMLMCFYRGESDYESEEIYNFLLGIFMRFDVYIA